jgi:hypothetical protein
MRSMDVRVERPVRPRREDKVLHFTCETTPVHEDTVLNLVWKFMAVANEGQLRCTWWCTYCLVGGAWMNVQVP